MVGRDARIAELAAKIREASPLESDPLRQGIDALMAQMKGFASTLGRVKGYNDDVQRTEGNITYRDSHMVSVGCAALEPAAGSPLWRPAHCVWKTSFLIRPIWPLVTRMKCAEGGRKGVQLGFCPLRTGPF